MMCSVHINHIYLDREKFIFIYSYKRASKTDIKCSWLKHPKSAPPKSTVTMSDLYPPKQQEYKYVFINKLLANERERERELTKLITIYILYKNIYF